MTDKCCEKCKYILLPEAWATPHAQCPCHTEADVQESMKASMTDWKDLTPEQKREIGLTAAKEANAAQRKIATPATEDWEKAFDKRFTATDWSGARAMINIAGYEKESCKYIKEFIRETITTQRAAERERVVQFILKDPGSAHLEPQTIEYARLLNDDKHETSL